MKTTKNPWSPFWLKGGGASFLDKKDNLQSYQMRKFWIQNLQQHELKEPIVDVGCGNGVVVKWLTEYAAEKDVKLDVRGIDAAQLNPADTSLKLHSETPYETFQLGGNRKVGSFVSHYGLEYGDLDTGLPNLYQQLKKGGKLLALIHSEHSIISNNSKVMFNFIPSLLKQLRKAVQPLQQGLLKEGPGKLTRSALQAQDELNRFARKNERFGAFHASNFYPATQHLLKLAAQGQRQASEKVLSDYIANIEEHRERLQSVLKAEQSVANPVALVDQLQAVGFRNIQLDDAEFPETGVVGRFVSATK